jgi:hypothetical protein
MCFDYNHRVAPKRAATILNESLSRTALSAKYHLREWELRGGGFSLSQDQGRSSGFTQVPEGREANPEAKTT